tara:strand:- start:3536 stop:3970 length:435 start_codon:yes stop_codon:yes gene_type:complete
MSKQIGNYVIFILPKDALSCTGSAIGPKYKAVGVYRPVESMKVVLESAHLTPIGRHALGIHILRSKGWKAACGHRTNLVAMAYRAERMTQMLRDYPDALTEDSVRWLGLEDYDESVEWMPEGKWCGDAPRHREWLVYQQEVSDG